jgi:hypothetical protein
MFLHHVVLGALHGQIGAQVFPTHARAVRLEVGEITVEGLAEFPGARADELQAGVAVGRVRTGGAGAETAGRNCGTRSHRCRAAGSRCMAAAQLIAFPATSIKMAR